jgi:ABC-2 type transport system ATP-binding protein
MTSIIRAEGLTKRYGASRGVSDIDLAVEAGEVFGFLGPNGAGKTTTIRLMLDLIRPDAGSVRLFGLDPRRDALAVRRRIGYVPGDLRLPDRLTGREIVAYFARLRGMRDLAPALAIATRLGADLDRPVRTLSRGNRQKVGLVQAFMHGPDLLLLDEPTGGLDPIVQQVFHELVNEAAHDGRTVFLSSHVLSEVQQLAHRVAVLREGQVELVETIESLRARALTRVEVCFATAPPIGSFDAVPGVRELERHGPVVTFSLSAEADSLVKALAGHHVVSLDSDEADLEDVFLALYDRAVAR